MAAVGSRVRYGTRAPRVHVVVAAAAAPAAARRVVWRYAPAAPTAHLSTVLFEPAPREPLNKPLND